MGTVDLGGARFTLDVDQEPLIRGMAHGQAKAEQSSRAIARQIMAELEGAARASKKSTDEISANIDRMGKSGGNSMGQLAIRTAGWAAAMIEAKEVLAGIAKITADADKAQRELNAHYKAGSDTLTEFAKANALSLGSTSTGVQKSLSALAELNKMYGFSRDEITALLKRAADLAAELSIPLPEAAEKVTAAILGSSKAASDLGLTIDKETIRATANLTAEQKRNFDSLDEITKARLAYQVLMKQSADAEGEVGRLMDGNTAGFIRLQKAAEDAGKGIGQTFTPSLNVMAEGLARAIELAGRLAQSMKSVDQYGIGIEQAMQQQGLLGTDPGVAGGDGRPVFGPTQEEIRNIQAIAEEEKRIAEAQARQRRAEDERSAAEAIKALTRATEERAAAEIEAVKVEADHKKKALDQEKIRLEVEREAKLKAVAAKRDAALEGIAAERDAYERAHQARLAQLQVAKAAEQRAAEDTRTASLKAIEEEKQAVIDSIDAQVIATQKARDATKQLAEGRRDEALSAIDAEREAYEDAHRLEVALAQRAKQEALKGADATRDAALEAIDEEQHTREQAHKQRLTRADVAKDREIRAIEASHQAFERAIQSEQDSVEARRDTALRAIDDERRAAQDASRDRQKQIHDEIDAERRRHQEVLDSLESEQQARLGPLQDALKQLQQQDQSAQSVERAIQLAQALETARLDLEEANATGSVRDILDARQKVADAEREIRNHQAEELRTSQKRQIEDQIDAIESEIDARKDQAKRELDIRLDALEKAQDAERGALDQTLRSLDERQAAVQDTATAEIKAIRERAQAEKDAHDESLGRTRKRFDDESARIKKREQDERDSYAERKKTVQQAYESEREQIQATYDDPVDGIFAKFAEQARQAKRAYDDRADAVRLAYEDEQRQIAVTYDDPETGLLAKLKQQKVETEREYGRRSEAVNAAYDEEQRRIEDVYDHPQHGLFAKIKQQADDAEREYERRTKAVRSSYDVEREKIDDVYANTAKTGLLDRIEQARADTESKLASQVTYWQNWKRDVTKEIQEAGKDLDEFNRKIKELEREIGITVQGSRTDGSSGRPVGGGGAAYPVVTAAKAHSYVTDQGTHAGGPAADIFADRGSSIFAPVGGFLDAFNAGKGGNAAILRGDDGRSYYFAHGNVPFSGGQVERGQRIGQVGNTGAEGTDPHLHFAISSDHSDGFRRGVNGGSGNVWFGSELWRTDGSMPDPLTGVAGDSDLIIELLGRRIQISGRNLRPQGGDLINAIERLGESLGGRSFGRAAAAISAAETGGGRFLTEIGGTNAKGPFQFDPGGELGNYAAFLGMSKYEAGEYATKNPMHAARWALSGYLGRALRTGIAEGLDGSPLAVYGSRYGQRPRAGEEEKAGEWHRRLYGYANGGLISEPTLLVGKYRGPYGVMAEKGAERILSSDETRTYGDSMQTAIVPVSLGGLPLVELVIKANRLAKITGRSTT